VNIVKHDVIYDVLKYLDLNLCIDVGAGSGSITNILSYNNTTIVAYEPFPGNHPLFCEYTKHLKNITLVKKAVSDKIDTLDFFVHSTVEGTEKGWEKHKGYSSVGFLSCVSKIKEENYPNGQKFKVDTVTLDSEFPDRNISFLKIDVQGAEEKVLKGAEKLLKENKVDILYIEWTGEAEITDLLVKNNYILFDSTYMTVPNIYNIVPFKNIGFEVLKELPLSTGKIAYDMILNSQDISPSEAILKVKEQKLGYIQTDVIAISPSYYPDFLNAVSKYNESQVDI